ncbi:unnamed protein product [Pedinophyceae sp. YPF-701]|nr:unnamed protein product [Pedinophyceae sp. YPF-701]
MDRAVAHLGNEFSVLVSGRPSPGMLQSVVVEAYGGKMELRSVSNIGLKQRTLVVTPHDAALSDAIERAINDSNLDLVASKQQSGEVYVPVPQRTPEHVQNLIKIAKSKAEHHKQTVRAVRKKGMGMCKPIASKDVRKVEETRVQELCDEFTRKIDGMLTGKVKDIEAV